MTPSLLYLLFTELLSFKNILEPRFSVFMGTIKNGVQFGKSGKYHLYLTGLYKKSVTS
jgi:hypothetical protein